jgi:glyoxylase-like metal-dependent hydrolase (beta-lactamase superfamily II)
MPCLLAPFAVSKSTYNGQQQPGTLNRMSSPRSRAEIVPFREERTGTYSYLVIDRATREAAVIDSVLDFDTSTQTISTPSADAILAALAARDARLVWILETHAHADHLSAAGYLKAKTGARTGIGEGICAVQRTFGPAYGFGPDFRTDGSQFDRLFRADETFAIGALEARVLATPGHTSDSVTYCIDDAAFVGDTLFMPDYGTARTDFPGGDAGQLYESIRAIYGLPPATRLFLCHDYPPATRAAECETTIAAQASGNIHLRSDTSRDEYIALRVGRDKQLSAPALLVPAVQFNLWAGQLPPGGLRPLDQSQLRKATAA